MNKKILFGVSPSKLFHVKEFAAVLSKREIECKVVIDSEIYGGFPSREITKWFHTSKNANKLFDSFKPDVVFVDRNRHFARAVLKQNLPLLSHLRGDYWSELKWYKETIGRDPVRRSIQYFRNNMEEYVFRNATMILPICNYLQNIVERRYHGKSSTLYQGIDVDGWCKFAGESFIDKNGKPLMHPCVGLLQDANIWGKAREMLILPKVLKALPDVTFYWAGDGPYRNKILETLDRYDNFHWLGSLKYPDEVKKYLNDIDVYALISGMDMSPLTLLEAQLMEKPVLATSVGGIPELLQNGTTGCLVPLQNPEDIISKINDFFSDEKGSLKMGKKGHQFVKNNFGWDKITVDFLNIVKSVVD